MGYTATTSDSRPTTLIDGIDASDTSRDQVRALLGEPDQTQQFLDMYDIDGKFLNIRYFLDMDRDHLAVIGRITPLLSAS